MRFGTGQDSAAADNNHIGYGDGCSCLPAGLLPLFIYRNKQLDFLWLVSVSIDGQIEDKPKDGQWHF